MKKIVKLLPVALALMLMSPAFASVAEQNSSMYSLQLDPFLDIRKIDETTTTSVTFNDDYSALTLAEALHTTFQVYTNDAEQKLYLYASAGNVDATDAPGLYGDASALKIIFGNTSEGDGSVAAVAQDIKNVASNPTESKNAFSLELRTACKKADVSPNGATGDPEASWGDNGVVTYSMSNGIYDMRYTTGTTAADSSFNTYDTKGTYKSTLYLTKTNI